MAEGGEEDEDEDEETVTVQGRPVPLSEVRKLSLSLSLSACLSLSLSLSLDCSLCCALCCALCPCGLCGRHTLARRHRLTTRWRAAGDRGRPRKHDRGRARTFLRGLPTGLMGAESTAESHRAAGAPHLASTCACNALPLPLSRSTVLGASEHKGKCPVAYTFSLFS